MNINEFTQRRRLLTLGALPVALFAPGSSYAFLDWIAEKAAENRRKRYESISDKTLVDALYVMLDGGKKEGLVPELREAGFKFNDLNLSMLAMERRIENTGDMAGARELMRGLVPDLDADVLAKIYGAVCKGRGNTVKVYKPAFSGRLNALFKQPLVFGQGRVEWYDRELSLIEWSPEGRVVSLLLHAHQASTSLGVMVYRHSMVLFGSASTRHVENSIRNSEFADYELRTL